VGRRRRWHLRPIGRSSLNDLDALGADVIVTGHTHIAVNQLHGKTLHINPGSANGLGNPPTVAMYDTVTGVGEIIGLGD
jgi:predicted phosphodiesterase